MMTGSVGDALDGDATDLSDLLERKAVSATELLDAVLARCERLNPNCNALVTLDIEGAKSAARAAEARQMAGARCGALDGIPLSIKDNLHVGGLRAAWGSKLFRNFVAPEDDITVGRLRAAGAVLVGKSNTPELALASHTNSPLFGPTRNPWNTALIPGGSSGGAAASVASGMLPLAVGTDAGGSIRQPAAYTGIVGFKPSAGRLPRLHGFPALVLDFQVIGLMSRSVRDIAACLLVMAGPDPRDRASLGFRGLGEEAAGPLRIAYVSQVAGQPVEPEIASQVAQAASVMRSLGHAVVPSEAIYDLEVLKDLWGVLSAAGVARVLRRHPGWEDEVTPFIRETATRGLAITAADYVDALDGLARFRAAVTEAVEPFDLVLTPTSPVFPWPVDGQPPSTVAGQPTDLRAPMSFTTFANAIGYPAVGLPCGFSSAGLPIGVQLVAPFGLEAPLLRAASAFEAAAPWRARRPAMAAG